MVRAGHGGAHFCPQRGHGFPSGQDSVGSIRFRDLGPSPGLGPLEAHQESVVLNRRAHGKAGRGGQEQGSEVCRGSACTQLSTHLPQLTPLSPRLPSLSPLQSSVSRAFSTPVDFPLVVFGTEILSVYPAHQLSISLRAEMVSFPACATVGE